MPKMHNTRDEGIVIDTNQFKNFLVRGQRKPDCMIPSYGLVTNAGNPNGALSFFPLVGINEQYDAKNDMIGGEECDS